MGSTTRTTALLALVLGLGATTALAGTLRYASPAVQILHDGPGSPGDALDIVILAEGFTSSQIPLFSSNANALKNAILSTPPYDTYSSFVRIWQVNTISSDSGADHPDRGVYRDTCFDCAYDGRVPWPRDMNLVRQSRDQVAGADAVILIVNDAQYGGGGIDGICTTYNGASMNTIVTHELGHAAVGLGDEYCYDRKTWTNGEPTAANLTTQPSASSAKWSAWSGETVSDGGVVSTFLGGNTSFAFGIYRPVNEACRMRSLDKGFCPVCREAVIRTFYSKTDPIRGWGSSAYWWNAGTFSAYIDEVVPDASTYVIWNVDGRWLGSTETRTEGRSTRHVLRTSLSPGFHWVTAWVVDTTSMLRIGGWGGRPMRARGWGFFQAWW